MLNRMVTLFFFLLLTAPITSFAMEQRFTQNDTTTIIKLTPDNPSAGKEVTLTVRLERSGEVVSDRLMTLEVYEGDGREPVLKRGVDVLDDEYLDSWTFDKPGDYKVVLNIADPGKPTEALHYEIKASVGSADDAKHEKHGFFSHHFGGSWGWWGGGLMLLMMVPMMILL